MSVLEVTRLAPEDQDALAPGSGWAGQVLRRLGRNKSAMFGLSLLLLVAAIALLAPLITRYNPNIINISAINQDPSGAHPLGTDYLGRDIWARIAYGGRNSLPAGFGAVAISLLLGAPLGVLAGYLGKIVDDLIMRFMDFQLAIPGLLLAIGIVTILGPSLRSVVIAIGIAGIPGYARVARGQTLKLRENEYIEAARAQGGGSLHILRRHILSNVIDPIVILGTLNLSGAILATASLSFLGFGTQPPSADWGTMLSRGYENMWQSSSQVIFPGLVILITVLGINLFGDGLGDALNPRVRSS